MKKILLSMALLSITSFASENLVTKAGWKLFGTSTGTPDMSSFNNDSVKMVWAFDEESNLWKAYSPDNTIQEMITNSYTIEKLSNLKKNEGFWILSNTADTISLNTVDNSAPISACVNVTSTQAPTTAYQPIYNGVLYDERTDVNNTVKWYGKEFTKDGSDYYMRLTAASDNPTDYSGKNIYIQAYDDLGAVGVQQAVATGNTINIQNKPYVNGTLYYKIWGYNKGSVYKYTFETFSGLSEGLEQNATTQYEYNDFQEIAYQIENNKLYDTRLTKTQDSVDWYSVPNVLQDNNYYLQITAASDNPTDYSGQNLYIQAYDDLGAVGTTQSVTTGNTITMQSKANVNGTLYYKIWGYDTGSVYKYSFITFKGLSEGLLQNETTEYEYNDFQEIAYKIENNKVYNARVTKTQDRVDWYSVADVLQDKSYYIKITASSDNPTDYSGKNLYIQAYDDLGTVGTTQSATTGNSISFETKPYVNGTLYYKIWGYDAGSVYKYSFETSQTAF